MRIKQNKKERFTAPSQTVGNWLTYRTEGHMCDDRAQTGPNGYCRDSDGNLIIMVGSLAENFNEGYS